MNTLIDHIAKMRDTLQEGERRARRAQYRVTVKLAGLLAGGIVSVGTTARLIELEREWWLITASAVLAVVWGRAASHAAAQLEATRSLRDGLGHAAECLPDQELIDFLTFLGTPPAPTSTEGPTPEDTTPTPEGTHPA